MKKFYHGPFKYHYISHCMNKLNIIPLKDKSKIPNMDKVSPYYYSKCDLEIHCVNTGVILGKTSENLVVIDIDNKELAKQLKIELKDLTYMVKTGNNGLHLYTRLDSIQGLRTTKLYKDNDIVGDFKVSGHIVAANSIHPNGNKYITLNEKPIANTSLKALKEMLSKFGITIGRRDGKKMTSDELLNDCCPNGEGNNRAYLAAIYYHNYSDNALEDLKKWNIRCCPDNPIDYTQLEQTFKSAENATIPTFLKKSVKQARVDITDKIVADIFEKRVIYSDVETRQIFENKGGYIVDITNILKKDLKEYRVKEGIYNEILFRLESDAPDVPKTNDDLIVFKNGIYSYSAKGLVKTADLATIGLPHITYFENAYPEQFSKIMLGDIPKDQHPRLLKALKSILRPYHDSRVSVIYGASGMGKSTGLGILQNILGAENAMSVNLEDFIKDRATMAKVVGKLLVIFQDMPSTFKAFTPMKILTGETTLNIRGFNQDAKQSKNTAKFFASANYLFDIPKIEENAMFSRRLSLITNTRKLQFEEDATLEQRVAEKEGDFIISWLLQIDPSVKYEDRESVRKLWTDIQSPQNPFLKKYYEFTEDRDAQIPVNAVKIHYEGLERTEIDLKALKNSIYNQGYSFQGAMITNIKRKILNEQETID